MDRYSENWENAPSSVQLAPDEIHIWRVNFEGKVIPNNPQETLLSDDEIARAARFHFERDRQRFAETRSALRKILSAYIPHKAPEIKFDYQQNGKPEISESQNPNCVRFNVSHSGRFAVIGVSLNLRIGIDVEKYRTMEFLDIARRYFSEREYRELKAAPAEELQRYFFTCWTRKEALLKAMGEGIGNLVHQVSVSVGSRYAQVADSRWNFPATRQWYLTDLNVDPDYAGAIAFEGTPVQIQYWNFQAGQDGI